MDASICIGAVASIWHMMKGMHGVFHKTSMQLAHEKAAAANSTPIAGQKRPWSNQDGDAIEDSVASKSVSHFQRTVSLPSGVARLNPSKIVSVSEASEASEYSQRVHVPATPTATQDPELHLSHPVYQLPSQLVRNLVSLGIRQIYPWQKSCLKGPGLLDGTSNLVYCAPTGGGKSLVADILMLKKILAEHDTKALLVLPYVALVQEKVRWLRAVVQGLTPPDDPSQLEKDSRLWKRRADEKTVRVVGFFGGGKIRATWADFDIGVCTIEKANAMVNNAIGDCSITKLRSVVLDELHMIDDAHRGYLMELVGTKLLSLEDPVQIVGMSATLPNMQLLAQWLRAHSYETRYRPVPIKEHLVHDSNIYPSELTYNLAQMPSQLSQIKSSLDRSCPSRKVSSSMHKELADPVLNAVISLAYETARAGYGVLVFAGSRGLCESDARLLSRVMPDINELDPTMADRRLDLLSDLRSLSTGVDPVLEETVPYGVAFHQNASIGKMITSSLEELLAMGLVNRDSFDNYEPTQLGKAVVASALDPDDGMFINQELSRTLKAFVMDGDMHILYTFTPIQDFGANVNWQIFRDEMQQLDDSGIRVLGFLGIKPTIVMKLAQGASFSDLPKADREISRVYRRFYMALQLRDLCNEMPIHTVARKYEVPRGIVQNLSQTCQGFAAGMIKFCEQMGWGVMSAALDHFSERLMAGARADLLCLTKIPFIKSRTARVFWENGFRTVASLANASAQELLPILMQAQPNKLRLKSKDDEKLEEKLLAKADVILASANRLWKKSLPIPDPEEDLWLSTVDGRYNSCPIPIRVGGFHNIQTFHVHRDVLTKSKWFQKALLGQFKEATEQAIDLPEEDPAVFHFVVAFLYENRFNPIRNAASALDPIIDKGKAREVPDDDGENSDSGSSSSSSSSSSTGSGNSSAAQSGHLEKHPGQHRNGCGCPRCLRPPGPPCWSCGRLPRLRTILIREPPGRIKDEDLRTWLMAYELSIDVYICANRYLLDNLCTAVMRHCIDMLETAGTDAAVPEVLQVCSKLYAGLPEGDPFLKMVLARVGFLQPLLWKHAPTETSEFLIGNPEVAACMLREMAIRHELDMDSQSLPPMEG
ncbi:Helicase POLQ-like protein [Paramyrothecium foliicola]|nr:Helicase POLQ-like protein [Paramyrothecium foliicola]